MIDGEYEYPVPRLSDSRPFLSLVERDYLSSMGNIPRDIWEPMSLQYDEADKAIKRVTGLVLKPELEPLRAQILEKWSRVIGWLDEILLKSQSVNALRSWQMVQSFGSHQDSGPRPVSGVVPVAPGDESRKRHGLRRR